MIEIILQPRLIMSKSASWKKQVNDTKTPLQPTFQPGKFDVICSRGKKAKSHSGNLFFQSLVEQSVKKYALEGKLGKSQIVSQLIDTIQKKAKSNCGGGFVKLTTDGKWYEVGMFSIREKVSQSFRDLLQGRYRSSASAKKRRKDQMTAKMIEDLDAIIDSNQFVSTQIKTLSTTIESQGNFVSDAYLISMMTQANSEILNQLKTDNALQEQMKLIHDSNEELKPSAKKEKSPYEV